MNTTVANRGGPETLHCLTGCAIGEVLGMVIGTALGMVGRWPTIVVLSIVLAFVFGYALTVRAGVARRASAEDGDLGWLWLPTRSRSRVMEIVDNAIIVAVPGALEAGLGVGCCSGAAWLSRWRSRSS